MRAARRCLAAAVLCRANNPVSMSVCASVNASDAMRVELLRNRRDIEMSISKIMNTILQPSQRCTSIDDRRERPIASWDRPASGSCVSRHLLAMTDTGISARLDDQKLRMPQRCSDPRVTLDRRLRERRNGEESRIAGEKANENDVKGVVVQSSTALGVDVPLDSPMARWGKKFFGNIFHGMRNYSYPMSRWYSRRYGMKKHRYKKRWQFRRYKLASIANLPLGKMIRIGLLPELKSGATATKSEDATPDVTSLIRSALNAQQGGKGADKKMTRSRPKSKYQT